MCPPDRDPEGNAGKDLHADAQLELLRNRQPPDRTKKKGFRVGEPYPEQLTEHQARSRRRINALEPYPGCALVLDLPGLRGEIRRGDALVLARDDAPDGRYLLVLYLRQFPERARHAERPAGDELVHGGHPGADLGGAARPVARIRPRLPVLAPSPIEHHQQALRKGSGDLLAEAERRRGLALLQQADAFAHALADFLDIEDPDFFALGGAARGAGCAGQIDDERGGTVAGGARRRPDRDLARPALEPERNKLDLARRELAGAGEMEQQDLSVGLDAVGPPVLVDRMRDAVSGDFPLLGESVDAVEHLPFALADILIGPVTGHQLLPRAPQCALAHEPRAQAGGAAGGRLQAVLIAV